MSKHLKLPKQSKLSRFFSNSVPNFISNSVSSLIPKPIKRFFKRIRIIWENCAVVEKYITKSMFFVFVLSHKYLLSAIDLDDRMVINVYYSNWHKVWQVVISDDTDIDKVIKDFKPKKIKYKKHNHK